MRQNSNKIVHDYLKAVKKRTPSAYRSRLISELQSSLDVFTEHHYISHIDDLYQEFGTPDSYVRGYLANLDSAMIHSSLKKLKRCNTILIALVASLSVLLVVSFVWIMGEGKRHTNTYYSVESISEANSP